jgi:ABC-type phosphate/phosphonate transport system permease subunit
VKWTLVRVAEGMETEMVTTGYLNRLLSTLRIAIPSRILGTLLPFALCMLSKDAMYSFPMLTFSFRCGG